MKAMLTNRNQFTIPKSDVNKLGLELGKYYEMIIKDDQIIIDLSKSYDSPDEPIIEEEKVSIKETKKIRESNINKDIKKSSKLRIKSNLEESKTFTRRMISECGLLVRTKTSYLNKACEECRGALAEEYGVEDHPCRYLKTSDVKKEETSLKESIIDKIRNNTKILNNQIDEKIKTVQIKKSFKKSKEHDDNTCLEFFKSNDYRKCKNCAEYYNIGFLIDNVFYCSDCAAKDFNEYIKRKKDDQ